MEDFMDEAGQMIFLFLSSSSSTSAKTLPVLAWPQGNEHAKK
jgi:hypothetical protein